MAPTAIAAHRPLIDAPRDLPTPRQLDDARCALRLYAFERSDEQSFLLLCALLLIVSGAAMLSTGGATPPVTAVGFALFLLGVVVSLGARLRLERALRLVAQSHGLAPDVARREARAAADAWQPTTEPPWATSTSTDSAPPRHEHPPLLQRVL